MTEKLTFSEALKAAKKAAGMTQKDIFEQMKIPKRTVEEWERGNNIPAEYIQRFVLKELDEIAQKKA